MSRKNFVVLYVVSRCVHWEWLDINKFTVSTSHNNNVTIEQKPESIWRITVNCIVGELYMKAWRSRVWQWKLWLRAVVHLCHKTDATIVAGRTAQLGWVQPLYCTKVLSWPRLNLPSSSLIGWRSVLIELTEYTRWSVDCLLSMAQGTIGGCWRWHGVCLVSADRSCWAWSMLYVTFADLTAPPHSAANATRTIASHLSVSPTLVAVSIRLHFAADVFHFALHG